MPYPYTLQDPPPEVTPNPFIFPTEFVQGDEFTFRYADSGIYPITDGWTINLSLRGGGTAIDIASTVDGGNYLLEVAPAVTALWAPGKYIAQLYALLAASHKRTTIWEVYVRVLPNLAVAAAGTDQRTHARRTLEAIEATIEGRAGDDILDSQIDNTTFRRLAPDQLLRLHSYYVAKVRSEEAKARALAGLATGRNILARFTTPH